MDNGAPALNRRGELEQRLLSGGVLNQQEFNELGEIYAGDMPHRLRIRQELRQRMQGGPPLNPDELNELRQVNKEDERAPLLRHVNQVMRAEADQMGLGRSGTARALSTAAAVVMEAADGED
jgi:hypothetical protein